MTERVETTLKASSTSARRTSSVAGCCVISVNLPTNTYILGGGSLPVFLSLYDGKGAAAALPGQLKRRGQRPFPDSGQQLLRKQ